MFKVMHIGRGEQVGYCVTENGMARKLDEKEDRATEEKDFGVYATSDLWAEADDPGNSYTGAPT